MDKNSITRFLAEEVLGWELINDGVYSNKDTGLAEWRKSWISKDEEGEYTHEFWEDEFDPFNNIAHIRMVEDAIAEMGEVRLDYARHLIREINKAENTYDTDLNLFFNAALATPEQRTIAATRALASSDQLQEWRL